MKKVKDSYIDEEVWILIRHGEVSSICNNEQHAKNSVRYLHTVGGEDAEYAKATVTWEDE
jgi:hypothetical protein